MAPQKDPSPEGFFSANFYIKGVIMKTLDASGRKEGKAKAKKPRVGASPGPSKPAAPQNQEFDESVQL
jgi:hypothetical protein